MTGKNALCPCGSGKKYKRCCMGSKGVARISPVVDETGARHVPPSLATVHYARPILDLENRISNPNMDGLIDVSMAMWNLALNERHDTASIYDRQFLECAFEELGIEEPSEFVDMMVERHRAMFPDIDANPGDPLIKEIVVDPRPPWTPFDETEIPNRDVPPADSEEDDEAIAAMHDFDNLICDAEWDLLERELSRIQRKVTEGFGTWLVRRGAPPEIATDMDMAIMQFLHYTGLIARQPLLGKPEKAVPMFLNTWLFYHNDMDASTHSAAPSGLRYFGAYLDVAGLTDDLETRMQDAIAPQLAGLEKTLALYYGPPSKPGER